MTGVYNPGDIVTSDGSTYLCKAPTGTNPPEVTKPGEGTQWVTYWSRVASRGDNGPQGPEGPIGVQGAVGAEGPQGPPATTAAPTARPLRR